MRKSLFSIKSMMLICLLLMCIWGLSSISFASNENTFSFSNNGVTAKNDSGSGYKIEGTSLTINEAGTYIITGSCSEGSVKVKKEVTGVNLILKDLNLSCSTTAPISLNKSSETSIEIQGTVSLSDKEDIKQEDSNEDFEGACIKLKSGGILNLKGSGTLKIDGSSCKNGIKGASTSKITIDGNIKFNVNVANSGIACDGSMIINGGIFDVTAEDAIKCDPDDEDTESLGDLTINGGNFTIKASSDGIRANGKLEINGGTYDIEASEGLEATYVLVDDGTFNISSTDDGINASNKSSRYSTKVEINGGNVTINMGRGDTDAVDANGELIITGGKLNITAQSAFDYDSKVTFTGGEVYVNGEKVTTINNQMMGGRGFGGRFGGMQGVNGQIGQQNMNNGEDRRQFPSGDFKNIKQGRQRFDDQNRQNMFPPEKPSGDFMQEPPDGFYGNMPGTKPSMWKNASNWAEEELNKAEQKSLIPEILNGNDFTNNITRQEFAHIIIRLYEALTNQKVNNVVENPFVDTNDSEVLKAYSLGITNGTSATTYAPNNLITREEMSTMITRAANKAGISSNIKTIDSRFADDSDMHDWGRNAIYFMSQNDIIKGVGNNKFDVKGNATKEQAVIIISRFVDKFGNK